MNDKLNNLIDIYLKNGVNLQKYQHLFLTIPLEHHDLGLLIKKKAIKEYGAKVYVYERDDLSVLVDKPDYHHQNYINKLKEVYTDKIKTLNDDCVYLELRAGIENINCKNIDYLNQLNDLIAELNQEFKIKKRNKGNVISCKTVIPTKYWADIIFSEDSLNKLWDVYFKITLADQLNPVELWNKRIADIQHYVKYLDEKQYRFLSFEDGKTSLMVELIDNHKWTGGCEITDKGIRYMPNFPTQEVFTAPKRFGVNGYFKNSKPLWYKNIMIDDFYLKFVDGEAIESGAEVNAETLKAIINYDDNSKYVGEIAILPGVTEISKSGILFNTTLLDENAACHLALGSAYPCSLNQKIAYNQESFNMYELNYANIHVDMMFGTEYINIKGIDSKGRYHDIIIDGNWVI